MSERVTIDEMASAIMDGLQEYADLATDDLKKAVKKAGKSVKDEIEVQTETLALTAIPRIYSIEIEG